MVLEQIFQNTTLKAKAKMKEICALLSNGELRMHELLEFADNITPSEKGTCIEAIECATRQSPEIADKALLKYVTIALKDEEPRVKWESAKVIRVIAKKFPESLDEAIDNLLENADHEGDVVRWATAYALGEIVKLETDHNEHLLPKVVDLCERENDNGVKRRYLEALEKVD